MSDKAKRRHLLISFGPGSINSYELDGDYLVGRLFGLFSVCRIHLAAVHYLRLASHAETPTAFMVLNWLHFLPHKKNSKALYVLQTRLKYRIFMRLDSKSHFLLRTEIGRHAVENTPMAA